MSAILFKQDDTQTSCATPNKEMNTHFGNTHAYINENDRAGCPVMDVCEELLGHKMASLDLNEMAVSQQQKQPNFEGSDSGVDVAANVNVSVLNADVTLQRALSNNSGGYTSSTGGLGDDHSTAHGINMSCDSSVISCGSDLGEQKLSTVGVGMESRSRLGNKYEYCSENGSESSSVTGSTAAAPKSSSVRKKVAMFEPGVKSGGGTLAIRTVDKQRDFKTPAVIVMGPMDASLLSQVRPRLSTVKRTASLPRPSQQNVLKTRDSRQNPLANDKMSVTAATSALFHGAIPARGSKQPPDSLPSALSRTQSMSMQRLVQRTSSLSRARTPGTPSDDGRWPSVSGCARSIVAKRGLSVTPDLASLKTRSSMQVSMESRPSSSNPYSTLPRRRKQKSVEDLTDHNSRSSSISRDARMTSSVILSSRRNLVNSYGGGTPTSTQIKMLTSGSNANKNVTTSTRKALQSRTRIYHETSVQTALTCDDLEKMFAGSCNAGRPVDAAEQRDEQTQADIRNQTDREVEHLRNEVLLLTQREHEMGAKLQREREEKLNMQHELHLNTERVIGMLEMARIAGGGSSSGGGGGSGTPNSDDSGGGHDSLLMLESQIQISGHELIERQQEIDHLRQLCRSLQLEMERSLTAQACLLQEKATIEQESNEMQDFLQHEKSAMHEALKELETEYHMCKQHLASRDEEVQVLRDECRHLVRLNEQRRQENRMWQTKYLALESKSKELVAQQNSSISGSSVALSGLHTRLDSLVEQLVSSYNISEKDLEDIGFQSDSQTISGSANCDDASHEHEDSAVQRLTLNGIDMSLTSASAPSFSHQQTSHQLLPQSSDGSLSPQRNQSFIAAVINAIRHATTPAGKRLLARNYKRTGSIYSASDASNTNNTNNNNNHNHINSSHEQRCIGDDSDSTEMLDSETEPCLMMDNVLEDVTMPDSHSHNMVSSCAGIVSQIEIPTELLHACTGDESLHNLSQAIANRQQMDLQVSAMNVQKMTGLPLNCSGQHFHDNTVSEEESCHDSVAEIPSLIEYCCSAQAVVDQVIEVDSLVTKLLKVLRLIQMDNDNCIQQLIVDKNKLQQNKEDMLEKLKDLEDMNIKLQDDLMDATQELLLKNNDLSNTKAEMQRHRNEIDRLTEDICNLSTLCSNYKKLSPTTEFAKMQLLSPVENDGGQDERVGILNLLNMWHVEGQLKDRRVRAFLGSLLPQQQQTQTQTNARENCERIRIYANQLENTLTVLGNCNNLEEAYPALQQLRKDIEVVKINANWAHIVGEGAEPVYYDGSMSGNCAAEEQDEGDENANAATTCESPIEKTN